MTRVNARVSVVLHDTTRSPVHSPALDPLRRNAQLHVVEDEGDRKNALDNLLAASHRLESCPGPEQLTQLESSLLERPGQRPALLRAIARFDDAGCFALLHHHGHGVTGASEALYRMIQHGVRRHDPSGRPLPASLVLELGRGRGVRYARAIEALTGLQAQFLRCAAPRERQGVAGDAAASTGLPTQGSGAVPTTLALREGDHTPRARRALLDEQAAHLGWLAGELTSMAGGVVWIDGWPFEKRHWISARAVKVFVAAWCDRERARSILPVPELARANAAGGPA